MSEHTVGVIGLGFGRAHISAFQARGCRVVALCQRDQAAAKTIADAYGVPQVFQHWEDMLATARPEIVVIATPPWLHHAIALAALGAGAHVLCEKPLAMSRAEAKAMVEAAARAGLVAMTNFNWRFTAAMQRFNAMARDGALGRVFHLDGRWFGGRWADETAPATWRMDHTQAGHGSMGDMGVHLIDLARWNFGEFTRVSAHAGIAYPSRTVPGGTRAADAEDFCTVLAELGSGAHVTLAVSRVAHGVNEHALEAYGSRGALAYRLAREGSRWYEGTLRVAGGTGALHPVEAQPLPGVTIAGSDPMDVIGQATIAPLVERFLEAIRTGVPASPSLEDGLRAQVVLDAVQESLASGGWVQLAP